MDFEPNDWQQGQPPHKCTHATSCLLHRVLSHWAGSFDFCTARLAPLPETMTGVFRVDPSAAAAPKLGALINVFTAVRKSLQWPRFGAAQVPARNLTLWTYGRLPHYPRESVPVAALNFARLGSKVCAERRQTPVSHVLTVQDHVRRAT